MLYIYTYLQYSQLIRLRTTLKLLLLYPVLFYDQYFTAMLLVFYMNLKYFIYTRIYISRTPSHLLLKCIRFSYPF